MPTPEELMGMGMTLMDKKSADYTSGYTDRYENFRRQAELISWFKEDIDKAFVAVIAIKLARLGSLLGNKSPKNESIQDTFIDLINYCALWGGCRLKPTIGELDKILNPIELPLPSHPFDKPSPF